MRIDGIAPIVAATLTRVAGETGAPRFAPDPPPAAPPPPAPLAHPATSVGMLVTLAAVDPAVERRRRQAREADRGLSLLERLRDQLSVGLASPAQLHALAAWAEQLPLPDDPALAAIVRDIDLRVRVELARHDAA